MRFPIYCSTRKDPSCRSRSFLFGCPRKKRCFVTTVTLSPRTKCGAVDGSERACISSLCRFNTERTTPCTSCSNFHRSVASCETGIEGRILNTESRAPHERTQVWHDRVCVQFQAHEWRCTQISLEATSLSILFHRSNKSIEETVETCC
jgi:hypothetical protein